MNIIKNGANFAQNNKRIWTKDDYKFTCSSCGSELEYCLSDIEYDDNERAYVTCPCCGSLHSIEDKEVSADNFIFPNDFYAFKKGDFVTDEKVTGWINEGIVWLRDHTDYDYWYMDTGGTFVMVDRYDGDEEFNVKVCYGFYEGNLVYNDSDRTSFLSDGEGNGRAATYRLNTDR